MRFRARVVLNAAEPGRPEFSLPLPAQSFLYRFGGTTFGGEIRALRHDSGSGPLVPGAGGEYVIVLAVPGAAVHEGDAFDIWYGARVGSGTVLSVAVD